MRYINYLLISTLLISSTGCMSMRPVEDPSAFIDKVKVGDKVELIDKDGFINRFTVGKVTDQLIAGNSESGNRVSVPTAEIERLSVEKVDGGRTTLAVMGGIVAIPIILIGAGAMAAACGGNC